MSKTIAVLSIDGGGIRGVIPAMILTELEKITGKPISQLFDLVAGTSTGGIISLALTKPKSSQDLSPAFTAKDLVQMYEKNGSRIFSKSLLHTIVAAGNLLEEKYTSTGIEGVLKEYFGDLKLSQSLLPVIIPAYETERRISWFFKSTRAKLDPEYDFLLRDVARSTSAAPTYFEPNKIKVDGPAGYYSFIDGGVYANNPAMCAYVEAKIMFPDADKIIFVSLGTGLQSNQLKYDDIKGWGLAKWAQPILNVVFDGIETTIDYQLQQLFQNPNTGIYQRFQPRLDGLSEDIDKADFENIRALKLLAERLIRENAKELNDLATSLINAKE
ncbi:MAG: patatin-like phospholipase family protein [bacterium]